AAHTLGPLQPHNGACLLPNPPEGLCDDKSTGAPSPAAGTSNAPQAQPGSWSIVNSPNLTGAWRDTLTGASCISSTDCWVAGERRSATDYSHALTAQWDGTSWHLVDAPDPPGALNTSPSGIACASSSTCITVGLYSVTGGGSAPFSEGWDGSSWSLLNTPIPTGEQFGGFRGVACAGSDDCLAVGWSYAGGNNTTLTEHWDGSAWTVVAAVADAQFNGISCGIGGCWAVGTTEPASGSPQPFAAQWNSTAQSWSIASVQAPPGDQSAELDGVACAAATVCWAVGKVQPLFAPGFTPLMEQLSGGAWSVAPGGVPPSTLGGLSGAACVSASSCYAVGSTTSSGGTAPLIEQWNGTLWTESSVAAPSGAATSGLAAISCTSDCWTVGDAQPSTTYIEALLYRLNGSTWGQSSFPPSIGTNVNTLGGISCLSSFVCVSVGSHTDGQFAETLVEAWNGDAWTIVPSPSVNGLDNFLDGVSCVSTTACWAVGDAQNDSGSTAQPLIESWNGTAWTTGSAPAPTGAQVTLLTGVACVSMTDCWAVGYSFVGGTTVTGPAAATTLTEHFDGTSWSIVSSPNGSPGNNSVLESVTCVTSADCWAVGFSVGNTSAASGLVERWNGSQWQVASSEQSSGSDNAGLFGVTCADATHCWAVGYSYTTGTKNFFTWIEQWDAAAGAWARVPSPNPSPLPVDALFSVSCISDNDCWSAGTYGSNGLIYETLTLHWDGTTWGWVDSPNPGDQGQSLSAVACLNSGQCWTAGNYNDETDGTLQTLVETNGATAPVGVPETPWTVLLALLGTAVACYAGARARSKRRLNA
ncbi:MAG: hypothetical protein ABR498_03645, partial [Candidatus Dormibacteria bacterium]